MKKLLFLLPLMILLAVPNTVEAKKKKYPNGDYYEGEWKKGQPNGIGKMTYVNGDTYEGNWIMGKISGNGKMKFANGDIYEGEWVKKVISGYGRMIYVTADLYDGYWKDGKQDGFGKMLFANGNTYEGEWIMGEKNGSGKMIYSNDDIYEGNWKNGNQNGFGKMTYDSGDIYEGNWKDGKQDGIGKMTYTNDDVYYGNWSLGDANGKGKYTDAQNNIFEGNFEKGTPISGKITYSNGGYSKGEFQSPNIDDIKSLSKSCKLHNGACEKYIQTAGSFTGKILNGKYDEGKLTLANGEWFEGKWVNGMFSDGKCDANIGDSYYQGEWKNGNFYTGKSKGKIGDNYYDGVWINGVFQGKCRLIFRNNKDGFKNFEGVIDESGVMDGTVEYADSIIYKGVLKNKKKDGNGALYSSTGNILIEGQWKEDNLIQGKGEYIYKNSIYPFAINKSNNIYYIKAETDSEIITCKQKINPGEHSVFLQMNNILFDLRRKQEEEKKKEDEEKKKKEELIALQKDIANAKYYYWTPSEIHRLYEENPAKFDETFYGSFLGDATLIRGKIANIRREIESGLFGDDIYYNIYLDGGVVIQTHKKSVVSQIQKGQTVFMLAKYKNETTNKYGYTQSPIFRLVTDEFIANSIDAVSKYLKEKRDTGEKVYENYYFRNLVRNIYR